MKLSDLVSRRALLLLAFTVAACGTDPNGPPAASPKMDFDAFMARYSSSSIVGVLERTDVLKRNITVSATISKRGGTIEIGEAGVTLVVPANALNGASSMTFTVTALAGNAVAYEFGPHGTTFSAPLTIVQELKKTSWNRVRDLSGLEGAYFADQAQVSSDGTLAAVDEFRPTLVELERNRISFTVDHFSGYLISSGRTVTR